jgi:hypothetical protein
MRTSLIGGDSAHRGLLGGTVSKPRMIVLGIAVAIGLICSAIWSLPGLVVLVGLPLLGWVATIQTENNTILARYLVRLRWREQRRQGTLTFVPYDKDGWDSLTDRWADSDGRQNRRQAMKELHAMRTTPDGVEGMRWLQDGFQLPGIQWHQPTHGQEYLAVVFSTTGQVEGIEDDPVFDAATAGFESVLAGIGDPLSLPNRIQTITRVLPSDPAEHEAWLVQNGDPKAPKILHDSYLEVVDAISGAQLVQRPMFVVSWPVTDRFVARAERRSDGIDGWLDLMGTEIRAMGNAFTAAGFRNVRPLTARQTAAVLRHLQHPGFPFDQAGDILPDRAWLPSEDSWSYTTYVGAPRGKLSQSLSRTCRITAKNVEITHRTGLWMAPLLGEMTAQVVRTISFHLELTPQDSARFLAEKDRVSDIADKNRRSRAGVLDDASLNVEEQAARRRIEDLTPGTGHVGANWVGYITVTAGTRRELIDACEHTAASAANAGINVLEWLDPFQQTANAYTWPVGRGITPSGASASTQLEKFAAGKEAKESL